jgi:hypothetical protein
LIGDKKDRVRDVENLGKKKGGSKMADVEVSGL